MAENDDGNPFNIFESLEIHLQKRMRITYLDVSKLKSRRFNQKGMRYVMNLLRIMPFMLAGGAARASTYGGKNRKMYLGDTAINKIADFDIFFWTPEQKDKLREELTKREAKLVFECPEGKLFTYEVKVGDDVIKLQLICEFYYESPAQLLNTFDFTCTQFCIYSTLKTTEAHIHNKGYMMGMSVFNGERDLLLCFSRQGLKDAIYRRLRLWILTYPVATFGRIIKYVNKGWRKGDIIEDFLMRYHQQNWTDEQRRRYID